MEQVGTENGSRELPIAVESWRPFASPGASLSCILLGVADTLVEGTPELEIFLGS